MQCKNSMVVKGGRMARKERGREGRGGSQQYSSPSALFSHYCLFSLKFLWLLVKMPTWFSALTPSMSPIRPFMRVLLSHIA